MWEILEEINLRRGNQTKCLRNDLNNANYGIPSIHNAVNTI